MIFGIMLALFGLFLYSAWDVIYFAIIYEEKYIYEGVGDADQPGKYLRSRKLDYFAGTLIAEVLVLFALMHAYFTTYDWASIAQ